MNGSMWAYFFMVMGILGVVFINIFGNVIISNEQNYYLLKEITEAALIDAVDLNAYRDGIGYDGVTEDSDDTDSMHCIEGVPGTIRIVEQKFVESFVRRFAGSAQLNKKYTIIFNDIDECPPKVTVTLVVNEQFDFLSMFDVEYSTEGEQIVNVITGILENTTPSTYQ